VSLITAIYDRLKTITNTTVSPELRRLGDPTPAVNYSVEWEWALAMDGSRTEYRTATVRAQCFADTLLVAEARAESVAGKLDGKWTQGAYSAVCRSVACAQGMAQPDDGQGDAERYVIVTAELQIKET
jgi:hypothetical protein